MRNIIYRIREIIDSKGISERKFCLEVGVSNGFLNKVSDIGTSKLTKILSRYPEINPLWLLNGTGKMYTANPQSNNFMNGDFEPQMNGNDEKINNSDVYDLLEKHFPESEMKELDKQLNLLTKIIKTNKEEDVTNCYESIYCSIELLKSYLEHYDVYYNMTGVIEDLRKKKVGIDVVIKEFKEKIAVEKELYKIIEPYAGVINEIYNKVSDFNEMHDRLYCYDEEKDTKK